MQAFIYARRVKNASSNAKANLAQPKSAKEHAGLKRASMRFFAALLSALSAPAT
jgi:hypothetical protein